MKGIETIFVEYLDPRIGYKEEKHLVQFAGKSDSASKFGILQTWSMPYESKKEAEEMHKTLAGQMKATGKTMIVYDKRRFK